MLTPRQSTQIRYIHVINHYFLMCNYFIFARHVASIGGDTSCVFINILAGLPGFARDRCSIIMSICAFHFYIIYFHFFSADHGIPQTFDHILTT